MKIALFIIVVVLATLIVLYFVLIGNTDRSEPKVITLDQPIYVIGLEINTDDKSIYQDVAKVANQFNSIKKTYPISNLKEPWSSINISKDYNREKRTFTYVVGDVVSVIDYIPQGLKSYEIPPLTYAVFPIRPKSKIAWGITMGRMKKFIYTEWLPNSDYSPSDLFGEFELHDDRSLGKHPEINLHVAIKEKDNEIVIIEKTIHNSIGWAKAKDFNMLYSVIADDSNYIEVDPTPGLIRGISDFKKNEAFWGNPDFKAIRYEIRDLKINLSTSGDVAWYYCILDDINEWKGKPACWLNTRWTGVLEKREGRWVIVQMHFSFSNE